MPYKIFIVCDIVEGFDFTGMGGSKEDLIISIQFVEFLMNIWIRCDN